MEMHQVRYFLAICKELNFTRAAKRCGVAQPSLTRAIKRLEDELGGPLFHRDQKNTRLSSLGKLVQPQFAQIDLRARTARRQAKIFLKSGEALAVPQEDCGASY